MNSNSTIKIWIFNQNSYTPEDGPHIRHYAIGKYLARDNYEPFVFAGNELHHVGTRIETKNKLYREKYQEGVHFFYIKTHHYSKNDIHRIINIFSYYKRLIKITNEIAEKYGKPDVIYASSMYPTALVAGIKIAKKFGIKCICENRDIIPEGFITNGTLKENGFLSKIARNFMKIIYVKSDSLIFTMSGGPQYIVDNKWDTAHGGPINIDKVYYVNNGVDLEIARENEKKYILPDSDLDSKEIFKVVYFGAIRFLNQMPLFIDTAKELKSQGFYNIKILMWGSGTKTQEMKKELLKNNLDNIILKGFVDKKYIPGIANRADLFIGTGNSCLVGKYGMSFNKLFDYFAGGKPIILPFLVANSLVENSGAGTELSNPTGKELAKQIIRYANMTPLEYNLLCENSKKMAELFDYKVLTEEIKKIIYNTMQRD